MTSQQASGGEEIPPGRLRIIVREHKVQKGAGKVAGTQILQPGRRRARVLGHRQNDQVGAQQTHGDKRYRSESFAQRLVDVENLKIPHRLAHS